MQNCICKQSNIKIRLSNNIERTYEIVSDKISICDKSNDEIYSLIHFHPDVQILINYDNYILKRGKLMLYLYIKNCTITEDIYNYSPQYGVKNKAKLLRLDIIDKSESIAISVQERKKQ